MAMPTNGFDFYLPFDADMDEKIHSLTGTLSSSNAAKYFMLSSDTAGKFLQCINTQGGNSYYLKYPGSESLMQYGTGDFSVSFWLRSPNWSYFMNVVFEKKYNDNQDGFVVYADGSEPVLDMRIRNQADHFTETYCNSSAFLHWCFVRVGTVGYWYCNGVLDSTTEGAVTGSVSNDELFKIGYSAAWTYKQAVFDLKALRIYNRALTDSEITELSKEFADEGTSGGTGVVIDGLFLSTSKPTANQKGLLVNNKFFIPFAESSGSSGGTSAEYYKCASVDTGGTVIYGKTLVVSGAATSFYNGTYTLQDATATGYNRVWVHSNEEYALSYFASESTEGVSSGFWGFYKISDPSNADYSCKFNTENPWDNPTYISKTYEEEVLSIIHPTSTTGNTWSGYKAVFDSTAGTWSFEDTVTEGLTYTSVTPVVGGIYSADALVTAILYNKVFDNLIAYYKLDGNCRDSVNMYDGIPNNITFVDGKIGECVQTNGNSQYISLPNEVSVKGRTQVSYSGWCFIESTLSNEFYIITEIANSAGYTRATFGVSAALLPFAGVRTVATGDTGSFQKVTGTSPISKSTWYFLCAVFDLSNGNIILYVNGVAVDSLTVALSSFVDSDPYRIRIFEFEYSGSGSVRIDELGIWSKALSATEVSELYNNGAGKFL